MSVFKLDTTGINSLEAAMKQYQGNVEEAINDVLHNDGGQLISEEIMRLMPHSGNRTWKGKKKHAKESKSLLNENGNLSVTVKTKKNWQYLYFPDDGSNTVRHAGNQQFFRRGAENQADEIKNRCITRLVNDFESAI